MEELRNSPAEPALDKLAPILQEQLAVISARFTDREVLLDKIRNLENSGSRLEERNHYLERADLQMRDERDSLKTAESVLKDRIVQFELQHQLLHQQISQQEQSGQDAENLFQERIDVLEAEITTAKTNAEVLRQEQAKAVQDWEAKIQDAEVESSKNPLTTRN